MVPDLSTSQRGAAAEAEIAAAVCAEQVIDLIDHGVADLHFYTMNKADLVFAICHLIGLRPRASEVVSS